MSKTPIVYTGEYRKKIRENSAIQNVEQSSTLKAIRGISVKKVKTPTVVQYSKRKLVRGIVSVGVKSKK